MHYEGEKFFLAESYVKDALNKIGDIVTNIDNCINSRPVGYEYAVELYDLFFGMERVQQKVSDIDCTVSDLNISLCSLDPSFESVYLSYKSGSSIDKIVLCGDDENYVRANTVEYVRGILKSNSSNDPDLVDAMCDLFQEEIDKGNEEAYKLLISMMQYKNLKFKCNDSRSCYQPLNDTIYISVDAIYSKDTIFHEIGHSLHEYYTKEENPDNFETMKNNARKNIEKDSYWTFIDFFSSTYTDTYNKVRERILKENNMTLEEYIEYRAKEYEKGIPSSNIIMNSLLKTSELPKQLAANEFHSEIWEKTWEEIDSKGVTALMDSMDAIFDGQLLEGVYDSKGDYVNISGHGAKYYDGFRDKVNELFDSEVEYNEIIANYTSLRASNNKEGLASLKYMLGDELFSEVEKTYEKFGAN